MANKFWSSIGKGFSKLGKGLYDFNFGSDYGLFTNPSGAWDRFKNGESNVVARETNAINKAISEQNLQFQQNQFDYQKELNQLQMEREDTAIQRQVADAREAGISPLAMSGLGASTTPLTSASAPQQEQYRQNYRDTGNLEALGMLSQMFSSVQNFQMQNELIKRAKHDNGIILPSDRASMTFSHYDKTEELLKSAMSILGITPGTSGYAGIDTSVIDQVKGKVKDNVSKGMNILKDKANKVLSAELKIGKDASRSTQPLEETSTQLAEAISAFTEDEIKNIAVETQENNKPWTKDYKPKESFGTRFKREFKSRMENNKKMFLGGF